LQGSPTGWAPGRGCTRPEFGPPAFASEFGAEEWAGRRAEVFSGPIVFAGTRPRHRKRFGCGDPRACSSKVAVFCGCVGIRRAAFKAAVFNV